MKILVTGGAGFIGSWLVAELLRQGHGVVVVDNLSPQIHGDVPRPDVQWLYQSRSELQFVRGDIRDMAVMDKVLSEADAVVHLAAETGTGQSMYQIAHYYEVNQQATAALFEAIATRHRNVRKVVLASSRSIYGEGAYLLEGQPHVPSSREVAQLQLGRFEPIGPNGETLELIATPEDVPARPASVYAATKLANETLGQVFAQTYGVQVAALRFQNVYGERQSLRNPYTGILSIFSNRMRQGLPINIFEDGLESRDFVHVSDVVKAIMLTLQAEVAPYIVANIGSGVPTSVMTVAAKLRDLLGSSSTLEVTGDFRAGDIRHCYADTRRASELLGYQPQVTLDAGLKAFCDWVLTQPVLEDRSAQAQSELTQLGLGRMRG